MKKIIFASILAMIVLFFGACSESTTGDQVKSPDNSASPEETAVIEKNDTNAVGFDGTISGECFDISIIDAKWTDNLELSMGGGFSVPVEPERDGTKLLCLVFNAKNTTNETENLGLFNAYVDKQSVLPITVLGKLDDAMIFVGAVDSGMEMKTFQIWEIPETWEEFQLNYFESSGPECAQYFVIHPEDVGIE